MVIERCFLILYFEMGGGWVSTCSKVLNFFGLFLKRVVKLSLGNLCCDSLVLKIFPFLSKHFLPYENRPCFSFIEIILHFT